MATNNAVIVVNSNAPNSATSNALVCSPSSTVLSSSDSDDKKKSLVISCFVNEYTKEKVRIQASNGILELDLNTAKLSNALKNKIKALQASLPQIHEEESQILLHLNNNNIKIEPIIKCLTWCRFHCPCDTQGKRLKPPSPQEQKEYDSKFLDTEANELCELATASYFLDIKPLIDMTCLAIAKLIKDPATLIEFLHAGKSPDDIKKALRIASNFVPDSSEIMLQSKLVKGSSNGSNTPPAITTVKKVTNNTSSQQEKTKTNSIESKNSISDKLISKSSVDDLLNFINEGDKNKSKKKKETKKQQKKKKSSIKNEESDEEQDTTVSVEDDSKSVTDSIMSETSDFQQLSISPTHTNESEELDEFSHEFISVKSKKRNGKKQKQQEIQKQQKNLLGSHSSSSSVSLSTGSTPNSNLPNNGNLSKPTSLSTVVTPPLGNSKTEQNKNMDSAKTSAHTSFSAANNSFASSSSHVPHNVALVSTSTTNNNGTPNNISTSGFASSSSSNQSQYYYGYSMNNTSATSPSSFSGGSATNSTNSPHQINSSVNGGAWNDKLHQIVEQQNQSISFLNQQLEQQKLISNHQKMVSSQLVSQIQEQHSLIQDLQSLITKKDSDGRIQHGMVMQEQRIRDLEDLVKRQNGEISELKKMMMQVVSLLKSNFHNGPPISLSPTSPQPTTFLPGNSSNGSNLGPLNGSSTSTGPNNTIKSMHRSSSGEFPTQNVYDLFVGNSNASPLTSPLPLLNPSSISSTSTSNHTGPAMNHNSLFSSFISQYQ